MFFFSGFNGVSPISLITNGEKVFFFGQEMVKKNLDVKFIEQILDS